MTTVLSMFREFRPNTAVALMEAINQFKNDLGKSQCVNAEIDEEVRAHLINESALYYLIINNSFDTQTVPRQKMVNSPEHGTFLIIMPEGTPCRAFLDDLTSTHETNGYIIVTTPLNFIAMANRIAHRAHEVRKAGTLPDGMDPLMLNVILSNDKEMQYWGIIPGVTIEIWHSDKRIQNGCMATRVVNHTMNSDEICYKPTQWKHDDSRQRKAEFDVPPNIPIQPEGSPQSSEPKVIEKSTKKSTKAPPNIPIQPEGNPQSSEPKVTERPKEKSTKKSTKGK